ncbi:hypothetical protein I317_00192 [Kwoniella heveanensis CBS 569]|nr:hypothetical protein I317_00192 [Kwoniella heveanensis CBS 569]
MSLRAHTYTASVDAATLGGQSFHHSEPILLQRSPNSAEQGHPAQFADNPNVPSTTTTAVNVPTIVEPAASRAAFLNVGFGRLLGGATASTAGSAGLISVSSGRRLDSILEDDDYDDKSEYERKSRRKRNTRRITLQRMWRKILRNKQYLLYATVGLCCFYVILLQPHITAELETDSSPRGQKTDTLKSDGRSASASAKRVLPWQMSRHRKAVSRLAQVAQGLESHTIAAPGAGPGANAGDHKIENGFLTVNPKSTVHPIYQLIESAKFQWDAKVNRQSKTLKEAVQEYKRRYKTLPPKGFEKWWAYVREHNVQLPDEYDQIQKDLRPFRALSPRGLRTRLQEAAQLQDTFVIRIQRGIVRTETLYKAEGIHDKRMQHQLELLRPIAESLPDLQVVWSVHDTPRTMISHSHRMELNERIEEGEWLSLEEDVGHSDQGWAATCSYTTAINARSRFQSQTQNANNQQSSTYIPDTSFIKKRFIASHRAAMDICSNPDLINLHGSLIAGRKRQVEKLIPIFSLSKTEAHSDILGVPLEQWVDVDADIASTGTGAEGHHKKEVSWDEKRHDRLLWRGSNTGMHYATDTPWRGSQRTRLIKLTNINQKGHEADAQKIDLLASGRNSREPRTLEEGEWTANVADLNARFMDVGFTGSPIQCDIADGTCGELAQEYTWGTRINPEQAMEYKYVMDVDGNAWSARFERLLASGSLVFKSTIYPEWWTDRVQPWVHYVPIQLDYSDLYDAMVFFQGDHHSANADSDPESESHAHSGGGESALAREIAEAGKEWARTHWRKEDLVAYMFRLYLEWGRLMAPDRDAAGLVYSEDMEV